MIPAVPIHPGNSTLVPFHPKVSTMTNYNKLFNAIKTECEGQRSFAEISNFENIAKQAGLPLDKLPVYLNHLQDMGLIKYSIADRYIHLTSAGHKQQEFVK